MAGPATDPRFRGRDAETDVLVKAVEDAAAGRMTSVVVEGEAGIGKSRLLREALARVRDRDNQVVEAAAEELERTRPFGALADAFGCTVTAADPRRARIAGLLTAGVAGPAAVTVTSDPGMQFRVVDAFVDLAEEEALHRTLVIAIDDLQWADPSTLLTLDVLHRRLAYVPICAIVCLRFAPRSRELTRIVARLTDERGRRLSLNPLTDDTVRQLVVEMAGAEAAPALLPAAAGAGGNPLFVTELIRGLLAREAIDDADVTVTALPARLRRTILGRLSGLSATTLELLRSAAILGSRFTFDELATVTGRPAFDLSADLQQAFFHRILTDDGTYVRFRHDLIREAVYEDSPPSVRAGLHREAARRLAGAGISALRVAEVLAEAAEPGDDSAIAWLSKAARDAADTAPGIAVELLNRALALTSPTAAVSDPLRLERAALLLWAGRIPEAEAGCRELLDHPKDDLTGTSTHFVLGRCLLAQGRMHECLSELQLVDQSAAATAHQRAECLGWTGIAQMSLGNLDDAAAMADRARLAAEALNDHTTLGLALTASAGVLELQARYPAALSAIDRGIHHADLSPGRQGHRYPHYLDRACLLIDIDRFDAARASAEAGMRISEQLGTPWQLAAYQTVLAVQHFTTGDWDDAGEAWRQGQEQADEDTGVLGTFVVGHSVMSLIDLHRNDLEGARRSASLAAAARAAEDSYARYRGHWAAIARSQLLEAEGDLAAAHTTLVGAWDECAAAGLVAAYPTLGPNLVRLAVTDEDQDRAAQVTAAVAAVAAGNDVPSLTAAALLCQGLRDDDATVLGRAADAYAGATRRLESGLAHEEAGAAHARAGDGAAAAVHLKQALQVYEELDAGRDVARTQHRLRGLGVRPGRRGSRRRPRTGWDSLTETERTVIDLVAEGLSNPQIGERLFVSRRTVQTHLAHVFHKLQIASRSELAAAVTRRRSGG